MQAAKITPLHKKGPVLDPSNYHMVAVSGTKYRLYVNVLRVYVTEWCQRNNKIPDTLWVLSGLKHNPAHVHPQASAACCADSETSCFT